MANEAFIIKLAFRAESSDECAPMRLKASQTDRCDSDQHDHGTHDAAREMVLTKEQIHEEGTDDDGRLAQGDDKRKGCREHRIQHLFGSQEWRREIVAAESQKS
ncbi:MULTISPECIES: hypothetical protein [Serratia]|uniref:hypothetical protein n=1 Tax=Serratia TaxID=613 RepID=UPI002A59863E|nr:MULTISPECIES: hypothetical protein [Serratia]MDY0768493.1 hypothetical protein [Serratia nevei]MED6027242.1 hypothetical protein [Serratia marcescens]